MKEFCNQVCISSKCLYCSDPKFSDRQTWANSADPDQGLHCLLYHSHLFDEIPEGLASVFEF